MQASVTGSYESRRGNAVGTCMDGGDVSRQNSEQAGGTKYTHAVFVRAFPAEWSCSCAPGLCTKRANRHACLWEDNLRGERRKSSVNQELQRSSNTLTCTGVLPAKEAPLPGLTPGALAAKPMERAPIPDCVCECKQVARKGKMCISTSWLALM